MRERYQLKERDEMKEEMSEEKEHTTNSSHYLSPSAPDTQHPRPARPLHQDLSSGKIPLVGKGGGATRVLPSSFLEHVLRLAYCDFMLHLNQCKKPHAHPRAHLHIMFNEVFCS
ncbi:MAG: hypothetical protein GY852_01535 [bacterium]|nr:hypothetical protein [bacterium]